MKIGDRFYWVKIHPETYDFGYGDEIVHNHIDCPVCKKEYSETDQFLDLSDYCDMNGQTEIICGNCQTVFKRISDSWYDDCDLEIIHLEEKYEKMD